MANTYEVKQVKLPSIPQMLVRMQQGHRILLCAIRDGRRIESRTDGEARGFRTARGTLRHWGCVSNEGGTDELTERGNALLAAYLARSGKN